MPDLRLTLVQTDLVWENPDANRAHLEEIIWQHQPDTDLIVLPEMFTTGFTMNASPLAEPMRLTTFRWMRQMAAQTRAAITGSYIVKDNGNYYNRMLWVEPDGTFAYYDKRHLFRMARETDTYAPGTQQVVCAWRGWRVALQVCYDLRFPVWSRNVDNAYDVLLYVANWPAARHRAWQVLLPARAIENLSYVVGVNRTGTDGLGIAYGGGSAAFDGKGESLCQLDGRPALQTVTLRKAALDGLRQKFPAHRDADRFLLTPQEMPG